MARMEDDPPPAPLRPVATLIQSFVVDKEELIVEDVKRSVHSGPRLYVDSDVALLRVSESSPVLSILIYTVCGW
jgi:hypothetical protein